MKTTIYIIMISILCLVLFGCEKKMDVDDLLVKSLNKRLDIIEKYYNNNTKAIMELQKIDSKEEQFLIDLNSELKRVDSKISETELNEFKMKLKPLVERFNLMIEKNPALMSDPEILRTFGIFDLGF